MELNKISFDFDDPIVGQLWHVELDLEAKQTGSKRLLSRGCEFPSVNPVLVGQRHRYLYLNVTLEDTIHAPLQGIAKLDCDRDETQIWSPGPRGFAGEPIFVPRPGAIAEDEGYLLSVVYDAAEHKSYLVILDGQNLTKPLAKCHLNHHVPQGFHGSWLSRK